MATKQVNRMIFVLMMFSLCNCSPVADSRSAFSDFWQRQSRSLPLPYDPQSVIASCVDHLDGHRCSLYTCLAEQTRCADIEHSVAAKLCAALSTVVSSQHQHQLNSDVLRWGERTNQCLKLTLVGHVINDRLQCAEFQRKMRTDLHDCALLDDDVIMCRQLLLLQRRSTMRLFNRLHWMWVVEMARSCPRDVVSKFIRWALHDHHSVTNDTPSD